MAEQNRSPEHARPSDVAAPRQSAPQVGSDFQAKLEALQRQLDALEYLVKGQKVPGGLVALTVPIRVEEALHAVILDLQRDRHFRDKVMTALGRLELKYKQGSLTALVRAVCGESPA